MVNRTRDRKQEISKANTDVKVNDRYRIDRIQEKDGRYKMKATSILVDLGQLKWVIRQMRKAKKGQIEIFMMNDRKEFLQVIE